MSEKKPARILIVEDHAEMLQVLRKFLTEKGFQIQEAATGETALDIISQDVPDIILLDIMLPGISGIEVAREVRSNGNLEHYIPILMLSAKSEIKDVIAGLEVGADDYIIKPFSFDELMARVNSAIRIKKLNDDLRHQSIELENANQKIYQLNQTLIEKNKELRKKIYDLRNIFDVSLELHSIMDVERLINSTLLSLIGKFSCKSAIFLYATKKNEQRLTVFNSKGFYKTELEDLVIQKSDPLIRYLDESKSPQSTDKLPREILSSAGAKSLKKLNIELVSPVSIVHNNELLITINNIVAIALSNASLYDEVIQLSYTDGMTDLHNYRYFEMRLREEVLRHARNKQDVSLIILDVDFFKNYNDTLGHQAGDEVLKKLGKILKETVRENDIVARYGGEEFAVILPGVSRDGVVILAERIRAHVEESSFQNEEVQPSGKVTVSVGTASLPVDAEDVTNLIYKADTALYAAKRSGRNRVVQYTPDLT
jgi:two-component system cell cycle response regulator